MLVTFRSTATDPITLFGDTATQLLQLMGASGRVPGAFKAEEVPAALQRLEAAMAQQKQQAQAQPPTAAPPAVDEDWSAEDEEKTKEPPVQLTVRAVPLINLLKRAVTAQAEVLWEQGG